MGEGLSPKAWSRLFERKTRLMNTGLRMKPRKAQVKDKGLGAKSGDFELFRQLLGQKFRKNLGTLSVQVNPILKILALTNRIIALNEVNP